MLSQIQKDNLYKALKQSCPNGETAIIVFANYYYKIILENWLKFFNRTSNKSCIVIAMDQDLHKFLSRKIDPKLVVHVNGPLVTDREAWLEFMRVQMSVLRECLELGYDTLISDIDAIWIKNPFNDLNEIEDDLVFSPGSVQPPDALRSWGFVLCTGFFLSRACPAVNKFYEDVSKRMKSEGDQPAINKELIDRKIVWKKVKYYNLLCKDKKIVRAFDEVLQGTSKDLSVAVLPNFKYQRILEKNRSDAVVIHPGAQKNSYKKAIVLASLDLWSDFDFFYIIGWIYKKLKLLKIK